MDTPIPKAQDENYVSQDATVLPIFNSLQGRKKYSMEIWICFDLKIWLTINTCKLSN